MGPLFLQLYFELHFMLLIDEIWKMVPFADIYIHPFSTIKRTNTNLTMFLICRIREIIWLMYSSIPESYLLHCVHDRVQLCYDLALDNGKACHRVTLQTKDAGHLNKGCRSAVTQQATTSTNILSCGCQQFIFYLL